LGKVFDKVVDGRKDVVFGVEGRLRRSLAEERKEFVDFLDESEIITVHCVKRN
jgi:hypothetical protein